MWYYGSVGVNTSYPHWTWMWMTVFIGESVQSARSGECALASVGMKFLWLCYVMECPEMFHSELLRGVGQCFTNLVSEFWVGSKLFRVLRSQWKNFVFFCFFFFKADTKLSWSWQYLFEYTWVLDWFWLDCKQGLSPRIFEKNCTTHFVIRQTIFTWQNDPTR